MSQQKEKASLRKGPVSLPREAGKDYVRLMRAIVKHYNSYNFIIKI